MVALKEASVEYICGALAGSAGMITGYPFDTGKSPEVIEFDDMIVKQTLLRDIVVLLERYID